jgi:hypothetical protein
LSRLKQAADEAEALRASALASGQATRVAKKAAKVYDGGQADEEREATAKALRAAVQAAALKDDALHIQDHPPNCRAL